MVDTAYVMEALWSALAVLALVALNGFFVAAEFAIVKVRRTQLEGGTNDARRRAANHVTTHLNSYLSACQVGITMASLALGWIGEPAVSNVLVEPILGPYIGDPGILHGLSFGIAFAIITALHIVVGEVAPKSVAITHAYGTTMLVALPLRAFRKAFAPIVWSLNAAANGLLRLVGIKPLETSSEEYTIEELRLLLSQAPSSEGSARKSAEVASRVFGLRDLEARQIMVPRDRVIYLDVRKSFADNLQTVKQHPLTRFPLCDGTVDSVLGFVHQRDVFAAGEKDPPPRLEDLRREVLVAPATQRASQTLFEMLEKRRPMSIVVNEFGTTIGLVTLDDIFEELVGNLPSEFERTDSRLRVVGPGLYLVDATMPLHELQLVLREPIEDKRASTLGGFLNNQVGRIPAKGDKVRVGSYVFWVKEADRQRARLVEIRLIEDDEEPVAEAETARRARF